MSSLQDARRPGMLEGMTGVTQILGQIEQGDPAAADQLLPLVYGLRLLRGQLGVVRVHVDRLTIQVHGHDCFQSGALGSSFAHAVQIGKIQSQSMLDKFGRYARRCWYAEG